MYEGGVVEFVRYLDRAKHPLISEPLMLRVRARRDRRRGGAVVERQLTTKTCSASPTTSPSAMAAPIWRVFAARLTRQMTSYAESSGLTRKEKVSPHPATIAVRVSPPWSR